MKEIKRFSQRGITMISLVVTIVIMIILTTVIITDTDTGSDYKEYKLMCADVELLEDKARIYYSKYGELPITGEQLTDIQIQNETAEFYQIDTSKLSNLTLNYSADEFIIDITTWEVYYKDGIEYDGTIHYTD